MLIQIVQVTRFNTILFIILVLSLSLTSCWLDWEPTPPRPNLAKIKVLTIKRDSVDAVSPNQAIKLNINLVKYPAQNQMEFHELLGVCFEVDGETGGLCFANSAPTPLPKCIKVKNGANLTKDLGKYQLSEKEISFVHEIIFSCNEAKKVKVSATLWSDGIKPDLKPFISFSPSFVSVQFSIK